MEDQEWSIFGSGFTLLFGAMLKRKPFQVTEAGAFELHVLPNRKNSIIVNHDKN